MRCIVKDCFSKQLADEILWRGVLGGGVTQYTSICSILQILKFTIVISTKHPQRLGKPSHQFPPKPVINPTNLVVQIQGTSVASNPSPWRDAQLCGRTAIFQSSP